MLGEGRCSPEKGVRQCFPKKVTFEQGLDGDGRTTMTLSGGRMFQAQRTARVLRWKHAWHVPKPAKR